MRGLQERGPVATLRARASRQSKRRTGLILGVGTAVTAADQLTKACALWALDDGPISLLGPVQLSLAYNTAGAFGLGGSFVPFFAVVAVGLVLFMVARGAAGGRPAVAVALGLVLGGAFGNLADRVFRHPGSLRGAVVDFIDLRVWPVFNLADTAITCGCVLLVWANWRQHA